MHHSNTDRYSALLRLWLKMYTVRWLQKVKLAVFFTELQASKNRISSISKNARQNGIFYGWSSSLPSNQSSLLLQYFKTYVCYNIVRKYQYAGHIKLFHIFTKHYTHRLDRIYSKWGSKSWNIFCQHPIVKELPPSGNCMLSCIQSE